MPVPQGAYGGGGQPSCFDRMKMGFMMGMVVSLSCTVLLTALNCARQVGMCSGAIFGGVGALRMGMRGGELVQGVGKTMVQGGGTFGTFMAIGTGIRC